MCICCGEEFKGKSIGPHYKNSKRCADFKARVRSGKPRPHIIHAAPANAEEPQQQEQPIHPTDIFNDDDISSDSVNIEDVDDFFYSE